MVEDRNQVAAYPIHHVVFDDFRVVPINHDLFNRFQ